MIAITPNLLGPSVSNFSMESTFAIEDIPTENDAWTRHIFRRFTGMTSIEACAEKCQNYFPCDMIAYEGTSCHLGDSSSFTGSTTVETSGPVTVRTSIGCSI